MANRKKALRVVVVGAGIVGSAIAFHLARRGVQVEVVESGRPGGGASGHSFAYLNSFGKEPESYHDLNRRSMDMWDRFGRLLGAEVGLTWGGKLSWESTEEGAEELRRRAALLQSRGYPCRLMDRAEMLRLEPGLTPGEVALAVHTEIEGHVDPPRVARASMERVREAGGVVRLGTCATGLLARGDRAAAVQTADGDIGCDVVVLAAGLGSTALAGDMGVPLPQQESPGVVVRTDPRPPLFANAAVVYAPPIDGRREIHVRQCVDGSVMIGEGSQESLARDDSQPHADELLARAVYFLPALDGAAAIPVPVGYRPMPSDGLPVIGFADAAPNVYIAVMHSGVTLAPLVGEWAAIEIADGVRIGALEEYRVERLGGLLPGI